MKDLEQYRRKPIEPLAARKQANDPEPEDYVAFNAKDSVTRVKIRRANDATYAAQYLLLSAVVYDGDYGTSLVLMFGFITVHISGQNLQPVIAALEMGTADFIQEFDAERWAKPSDPKAPIIEKVEIESHSIASLAGQQPTGRTVRPH